jgi:hypothetical protein
MRASAIFVGSLYSRSHTLFDDNKRALNNFINGLDQELKDYLEKHRYVVYKSNYIIFLEDHPMFNSGMLADESITSRTNLIRITYRLQDVYLKEFIRNRIYPK